MRRVLLIAAFLITLSAPAMAQDAPLIEVFGGYSYLRLQGGTNLHGWNASVAVNTTNWHALVVDFSGHYGKLSSGSELMDDEFPTISPRPGSDASAYLFLFGPRFSSPRDRKISFYSHFLFGAAALRTDATLRFGDLASITSFARNSYAMATGGGLNINLSESVSLRPVQADYVLTQFSSRSQGNLRLSVGLVLQ